MTVAELITKLQEMPRDARVVIDGYEGGLEDVSSVSIIPVVLNKNGPRPDYYGLHEEWEPYMDQEPDESAVYIPR